MLAISLDHATSFRASFANTQTPDRHVLEKLTSWAEGLCRESVVDLSFGTSPKGRDCYLKLSPPGGTALLHIAHKGGSRVSVYSYGYATLGRERFLAERLGGSQAADAALLEAERLAQGDKLWTTSFGEATLVALENVLRFAAAVVPRDHVPRPRSQAEANTPTIFGIDHRGAVSKQRVAYFESLKRGDPRDLGSLLEVHLHSDRFYVEGDIIHLDLPESAPDAEEGYATVWFTIFDEYRPARVGRPLVYHALPSRWQAALCQLPARSVDDVRYAAEAEVTCRSCLIQLAALDVVRHARS